MGGKQAFPIDVRIIVASNIPLLKLVEEKKFRSDLYYRLNEFKIELPSLMKRKEDIPFLAKQFIEEGNLELKKNVSGLHKDSLTILINYSWPGNVRELKNVIKRAVLLAEDLIEPSHLIFDNGVPAPFPTLAEEEMLKDIPLKQVAKKAVCLAEKNAIVQTLSRCEGNKSKVSKMLKIDYKTLLSKIKEYHISYGAESMESVP
jgi:transcriptional regulator with PAS, ATPase and Fis domain